MTLSRPSEGADSLHRENVPSIGGISTTNGAQHLRNGFLVSGCKVECVAVVAWSWRWRGCRSRRNRHRIGGRPPARSGQS
jgi:hypothetical protein